VRRERYVPSAAAPSWTELCWDSLSREISGLEKPLASHEGPVTSVAGPFGKPGRPGTITAQPIKLRSPAELLAVIPHLLGFCPRADAADSLAWGAWAGGVAMWSQQRRCVTAPTSL
jgi:hypothetical protein